MTTTENATETIPCSRVQAKNLLRMTSVNNSTHLIGTPDTVVGQTLTGALALMDRLENITITKRNGGETLSGHLPGHGAHSWYLNRESVAADPWAI